MQKKNIFKALAFAMLMPAMLLTTACSSQDDVANINNEPTVKKGYTLPVTVNVTRQGDGTTRATYTYNENTKKGTLAFSDGDKLFVRGDHHVVGKFAGTLTWQSGGTFSGTIYTESPYEDTADDLFAAASAGSSPECYLTATLLPNGYDANSFLSIDDQGTTNIAYDDRLTVSYSNAFIASETAKATGVEQLSLEQASTYSNGFALEPQCAILNFTISGLAAGAQDVTLNVTPPNGDDYTVTGSVTPTSGVATFAIGVPVGANIKDTENNLTVGSSNFTLPSSTTFAAGKIYNIARNAIPGALIGVFSVSSTKKVYFSKGNLRYASGTWSFFEHQYDYYTSYSADAWDKFGWSTATTYGMNTSGDNNDYSGDFVDWGATMGTGWSTLSRDEWTYLFNTRSALAVGTTENACYAKAKVNDVQGVILFPDTYTHPDGVADPVGVNDAEYETGWNENNYSSADWTKMESAGCVFLPAAGYRAGTGVNLAGSDGYYWSSSDYEETGYARDVWFDSEDLNVENYDSRYFGHSVRLVRDVTEVTEVAGSYFTANSSGLKVAFSQGNLQATTTDGGTNWTWAFAEHQWDYVGNATAIANTSINGNGTVSANGTVEFFCWSTAKTYYGIHNSTDGNTYSGDFKDWGTLSISNGGGYTWRTLTSAEWKHIFNDRTSGATVNVTTNARWTHATINTDGTAVNGIILFPDGCKINSSSATWGTINGNSAWGTKCTKAQWTHLEELGCVFLPAAGSRHGSEVSYVGTMGCYWSATPTSGTHAYLVEFASNSLNSTLDYWRDHGRSVRLVREVPSN